jgi:hypothetical protein
MSNNSLQGSKYILVHALGMQRSYISKKTAKLAYL